jgi:hypothetical protein
METALAWTAVIGAAILLGFAVGFIRARWPRMIGLGIAFLFPPLLIVGYGLSNGCALRQGGEECFGYGFGLVIALGILPVWVILVIAGTWLTRRFQTRR